MSEMLSLIQTIVGVATLIVTVWAARAKTLEVVIRLIKGVDPPPSDGSTSKSED